MLTKTDLKEIDNVVAKRIKIETKPLKRDLSKIRKDTNVIVSMFDREYVELRDHVQKIEDHLNLTPVS